MEKKKRNENKETMKRRQKKSLSRKNGISGKQQNKKKV
jgi:hypothetical protein